MVTRGITTVVLFAGAGMLRQHANCRLFPVNDLRKSQMQPKAKLPAGVLSSMHAADPN